MSIIVNGEPRFAPGDTVRLKVAHDICGTVIRVSIFGRGMTTYEVTWIDAGKRNQETMDESEVEKAP